jgi:hypothetical protein
VVPAAQEFKEIVDEVKHAKITEADKRKVVVELQQQVNEIVKEKKDVQSVLEQENPISEWKWLTVINAYHTGDNLPGSGEAYTLQDAKLHGQAVEAVGFTQDLWLEHPDDTEGIFWFHSRVAETDKLPRETGRPDGMQNLYFRSEVKIPKAQASGSKVVAPMVSAPATGSTLSASLLGRISEDEERLSDHGSVEASGNASSVGDAEAIADVGDFDDRIYGFDPKLAEARLAEEAKLEKELRAQLAEEKAMKDQVADELAAEVAAKRNTLERLESRVEDAENWKSRAVEKVDRVAARVDEQIENRHAAAVAEKIALQRKKEEDIDKAKRVAELKQRSLELKNVMDEALPEWAEMRSFVALARAGQQIALMRVSDYQDALKASEARHVDVVQKLRAEIARMRDPSEGSSASRPSCEEGERPTPAARPTSRRDTSTTVAEVRRMLEEVRQESAVLSEELERMSLDHQAAKDALEKQVAVQVCQLESQHDGNVKELSLRHNRELQRLRLRLAEAFQATEI